MDLEGIEVIAMSETGAWRNGETVYISAALSTIHIFDEKTTNSIGYPKE